jgi:hypothetical protein
VVVLIAGALQFTAWKAHHHAGCREAPWRGRTLPADASTAWRHGQRLGLHCSHRCFGLMAILLVIGAMDLCARWLSWRQPSPSSVSHRPVSASPEPPGPSASGRVVSDRASSRARTAHPARCYAPGAIRVDMQGQTLTRR